MKRLIALGTLALLALASIVFAQARGQATLRLQSGDRPITWFQQGSVAFVSASEVVTALGGTLEPDNTGYKVTLNGVVAAFGPDTRYGVVREDLIEMPVPPMVVDGQVFVPWQFFQGLLTRAGDLDVSWDATAKTLSARPRQLNAVAVQTSLANVEGVSKLVVTLGAPTTYTILREPGVYIVRFKAPLRPAAPEQSFDDPNVSRVVVSGSDLRIHVTSPDVLADAYQLEEPFRVVIDLRRGAGASAPPTPARPTTPVDTPGIRTIVIDPGHGGKDVGATGPNGVTEKDVTLAISRRLADSLAAATGARVILTREDDTLIALDQRTALANQYGADLFLSVHLNAAPNKAARGSETYFLSLEASDELAKKAAESENTGASSVPGSGDLDLILWDLAQQEYLQESSRFALAIQEELNTATGVQNRGVKQAPFKVLLGATMPAALVEVAFISNADEESRIQTGEFQGLIVDAITRAVARYKSEYEVRLGIAQPPAATAPAPAPGQPATAAAPAGPATPARTGTR